MAAMLVKRLAVDLQPQLSARRPHERLGEFARLRPPRLDRRILLHRFRSIDALKPHPHSVAFQEKRIAVNDPQYLVRPRLKATSGGAATSDIRRFVAEQSQYNQQHDDRQHNQLTPVTAAIAAHG